MSTRCSSLLVSSALALLCTCCEGQEAPVSDLSKTIEGVPVKNYHLAQARPKSSDGTPTAWTKWILVMKHNVSDHQLNQFCKGQTCTCALRGHPGRGGVPFVALRCMESDMKLVLRAHPGYGEFIEPDIQLRVVPGMPATAQLGQELQLSASWGLDRIGEPETVRRGVGTHIYVLDTGIYTQHEDFEGRAIPTLDLSSGSAVECNGELNCAADRMGHGTHCAGIAAGHQYGVAKGATLHAVKVLNDQGSGTFSWIVSALDWVATFGKRPAVVSMSLGGYGRIYSMSTAIDAASAAGVTVVVAAGNEESNACEFTPAFVPSAVTVGATEASDAQAYYSNYGGCVDLYAPGSGITSAWITSQTASQVLSGTSMACPHVSGSAALLLGEHPTWDSKQVSAALVDSAERGVVGGDHQASTNFLLSVRDAPCRADAPAYSAAVALAAEAKVSPGPSMGMMALCATVGLTGLTTGALLGYFAGGLGLGLGLGRRSYSGRDFMPNAETEVSESPRFKQLAEVPRSGAHAVHGRYGSLLGLELMPRAATKLPESVRPPSAEV
mmetsp:Transcript_94384/g.246303  ORF Transcript_94384/g.246303 Transcript_94384/m.246303 type:complete len:554 (+) Transcript_94384:78-1739(+)